MILSPQANANVEHLVKSKGYDLNHQGKITNPDQTFKTNVGTMAHAKKCPLGEGQNASIFLAQNLDNGEFLAVKEYDKSRQKESYHIDDSKQIEIEQKVLKMLGMSRGIHRIEKENKLHVYMPYIDGVDLERAKSSEIGNVADALYYAQLATEKLLTLHKNNFIHADLHAGNVMICPKNKELYFVDFEKCKYMDPDTQELEIWGKPSFLPQRAYDKSRPKKGSGAILVPVNKETDKFGLGVALHTLFSKVLGENVLSIDANGNIHLNQVPNNISETSAKEIIKILHRLTQPGNNDLNSIASAFKTLKEKCEFEPTIPNTLLLSSKGSAQTKPANSAIKANLGLPNQIIGTQAIGAKYHFTQDDPVIEQAKRMIEMGSTIVKFSVTKEDQLDTLLKMPFSTYFLWWRAGSKKFDLTKNDLQAEYDATYKFAKELLLKNAKVEKTFYLGNWEGDWGLLQGYDRNKNPSQEEIQSIINWLNIRQKAVDDARQEFGSKSLSKVFHYAEVNLVRDAMNKNMKRVVNTVLPMTNVDYVSYSSYDVQRESQDTINSTVNYIESKLNPKPGISGPRVFIGEFGVPAKDVHYDPVKHEEENRKIIIKFLKSNVPYILYWQMYNNEIEKDQHKGFWLINDKNQKQPLYETFKGLYAAQNDFADIRNQSINWMENKKNKLKI